MRFLILAVITMFIGTQPTLTKTSQSFTKEASVSDKILRRRLLQSLQKIEISIATFRGGKHRNTENLNKEINA
ncbi:hypothetical protein DOE51_03355 [Bdellovibrio sp. NC01]|nr:hypothetical protein DOE51_03355 [Bdellovibrio sp. NC01]